MFKMSTLKKPGSTKRQQFRQQLELFETAIATITSVCRRTSQGDLEVRVPKLTDDNLLIPALEEVRWAINSLIDNTDAYVRESSATLQAAAEGRFYRQFLTRGTQGAFTTGAKTINYAYNEMRSADGLILDVASKVSEASTDLSNSAGALATSVGIGVSESKAARETVVLLEEASKQIEEAATLIQKVAAQTKLLAFNATIEAARAGEAGKGFNVVATEIRHLADATSESGSQIVQNIRQTQTAAAAASDAIAKISNVIQDIDRQADEISVAANGSGSQDDGLANLSELLRTRLADVVNDKRAFS